METKRIDINEISPGAYKPLFDLDAHLRKSSLTIHEYLLIEIRASQINGCAFCLQAHIKEAIEKGEKQYRVHALLTWRDAPYFTEEEKIILLITEQVTHISKNGVDDDTFNKGIQLLGEKKVADVIMAAACINTWNRIGRATQLVPYASQE
ncbi:MAG: carboxymuconolactone decarboxylase family protein [Cyclobacteriaceae bacterium]|nr:carboxymuconolactone decarboxylase family protein [Cyclobacteriaceae bacterium]